MQSHPSVQPRPGFRWAEWTHLVCVGCLLSCCLFKTILQTAAITTDKKWTQGRGSPLGLGRCVSDAWRPHPHRHRLHLELGKSLPVVRDEGLHLSDGSRHGRFVSVAASSHQLLQTAPRLLSIRSHAEHAVARGVARRKSTPKQGHQEWTWSSATFLRRDTFSICSWEYDGDWLCCKPSSWLRIASFSARRWYADEQQAWRSATCAWRASFSALSCTRAADPFSGLPLVSCSRGPSAEVVTFPVASRPAIIYP